MSVSRLLVIEPRKMLAAGMDMRVTDRMERDGKDVHPESYAQGVVNGIAAAINLLMPQFNDAQIDVMMGSFPGRNTVQAEIERTRP